ncbi:MAG: transposase [Verrucomicrobia bacterium]|nr:transposase [Verrucomicrobiota bacterium]
MRFTFRAVVVRVHHPNRTNHQSTYAPMASKTTTRPRGKKGNPTPKTTNPNAAGIDLGATVHYVAVPANRDAQPVRHFGTLTGDLNELADWLVKCRINTVAMEATGVYWIQLFQILEERGLEVFLVNARHVKNVPGRKSDVQDCQWLQYLHSVGLPASVAGAEGSRPDERATAPRGHRHHGSNRTGDPRCNPRRRARSLRAGAAAAFPLQEGVFGVRLDAR